MKWDWKILRKTYRPTYENGYLRIKINQEIYKKEMKSPDIVTVIKVCTFEWLGHVVRMVGERTVNKLMEDKTGGRRKRGRPR